MDPEPPKPPKPSEEQRLAERRLDEIAEILARAVLRILARDEFAATNPNPPAPKSRRSPKSDSPAR